jgi:hypothetical protein
LVIVLVVVIVVSDVSRCLTTQFTGVVRLQVGHHGGDYGALPFAAQANGGGGSGGSGSGGSPSNGAEEEAAAGLVGRRLRKEFMREDCSRCGERMRSDRK